MKQRFASSLIQTVMALLLTGCTQCQAAAYRPAESGQTLQWTFDNDPVGRPPAGSQPFSGKWEVRAETGAPSRPNALCQTGTAQYPALSLGDTIFADVVVSTDFKPISGKEDQAAGIIFRLQDRDNFYILRANALEDNVNLYKYVGGRRYVIKEAAAKVLSGTWQELRVEATGNAIRGFLNGKLVLETHDDTFTTGKVGLWTKSDSQTCFDNVKATAP